MNTGSGTVLEQYCDLRVLNLLLLLPLCVRFVFYWLWAMKRVDYDG